MNTLRVSTYLNLSKIAKGLITKRIPKIIRLIIRHAPLAIQNIYS